MPGRSGPRRPTGLRIVALYEVLAEVMPSPVVELNRAVAVSMAYGPQAGLELVDQLAAEPALRNYHLLPSVRGDLLRKLGRDGRGAGRVRARRRTDENERERELSARRARRLERQRLARPADVRECSTWPSPLLPGSPPSGQRRGRWYSGSTRPAELLEAWGLGDNPDGLDRFADIVLEAAPARLAWSSHSPRSTSGTAGAGIRTLQRLVASARAAGLLVILDIKRGDVGSTNDAYAEAYLGKGAPLAADAITVHPYLGLAAMGTFVSRAAESGSCLLVVTRSSNPEGRPGPGGVADGAAALRSSRNCCVRHRRAQRATGARRDRAGRRGDRPDSHDAAARPRGSQLPVPGARRRCAGRYAGRCGAGVRRLPGPGDAERVAVAVVGGPAGEPAAGRLSALAAEFRTVLA